MEKREIITQLEEVQGLYNRLSTIGHYLKTGADREMVEQTDGVLNTLGELPGIPSAAICVPAFYESKEAEIPPALEKKEQKSRWFRLVLIATGVCILLAFLTHWMFLNSVASVGVIACILLGLASSSSKKKYKELRQAEDAAKEQYEQSLEVFHIACASYEKEKAAGIAAAKEYGVRYEAAYGDMIRVAETWRDNKVAAAEEYTQVAREIQERDLVTEEYAHLIPKLITLLKSGRADTLKEALNIAIEEEREAAREAARQAEEQRRIAMMQQQMEEQRRHNQQMEHQAELQSQIAQEEVRRAAKEEKRREVVPGVGYRDKYGNYYNYKGMPIPPPVSRK